MFIPLCLRKVLVTRRNSIHNLLHIHEYIKSREACATYLETTTRLIYLFRQTNEPVVRRQPADRTSLSSLSTVQLFFFRSVLLLLPRVGSTAVILAQSHFLDSNSARVWRPLRRSVISIPDDDDLGVEGDSIQRKWQGSRGDRNVSGDGHDGKRERCSDFAGLNSVGVLMMLNVGRKCI